MASRGCGGIMIKKQVLEFVLKNWKVIAIAVLAAVIVLKTRYDYHLMEAAYTTMVKSNEAQIEGLKEIHKQEIEEKQLLMESFLESIAAIEEDYERTLAELEEEKKKEKRSYVKKFSEDKQELARDIEDIFGFEYVP